MVSTAHHQQIDTRMMAVGAICILRRVHDDSVSHARGLYRTKRTSGRFRTRVIMQRVPPSLCVDY
jgi:hypothetical protein